jgi:hypothetical protein
MAAYFWVGGTGTWSGTGNTQFAVTSGGVSTLLDPTNADTVTFDANSGTAATVTCTSTAVSLSTTINKSDITLLLSGSPTLCTAAGTCTLTAGTLNLVSYTLSTGLFSSSNTNTRVLNFGTGNITLTGVNATIFNTTTVTGMTITGTPVVNCTATTGTSVQTRTFIAGAHGESQSISVNINPGTSAVDIFRLATNSGAFKDVTFSSTFTGTLQISNSVIIYGNFDSGGATAHIGPTAITFAATSGTKTIKTSGLVFDCPFTFNGVGGTWQLQDALTSGATRTCTLTNGTLDLNGYTLTIGIFSSSNSNTRVLAFGSSGYISLTSASTTADVTIFTTSDSTNFIVSGLDPYIDVDGAPTSFVRSITPGTTSLGGSASNAISFYINAGSDTISFGTDNRVINDLVFGTNVTVAANAALQIYGSYSNGNYATITGGTNAWTFRATSLKSINSATAVPINNPVNFDGIGGIWQIVSSPVVNGAVTLTNGTLEIQNTTTLTVGSFATSGTNPKFLKSTSPGSQATLSDASGTNTVSYLTIQDSNATGGAVFDALAITNVDAGNNTGWLFSTTPSIGNEITMRLRSFTQPRRF